MAAGTRIYRVALSLVRIRKGWHSTSARNWGGEGAENMEYGDLNIFDLLIE